MRNEYSRAAKLLLKKGYENWDLKDLDLCGECLLREHLLKAEDALGLRKALVPDPALVRQMMKKCRRKPDDPGYPEYLKIGESISLEGGDPAGVPAGKTVSQRDKRCVRMEGKEPANPALCRAIAAAMMKNKSLYFSEQGRRSDIVDEFCACTWEYLRTTAFQRPWKREFSMVLCLCMAAKPNGWIGWRVAFPDEHARHRYMVMQKKSDPWMLSSRRHTEAGNRDEGGERQIGSTALDQYWEPLYGAAMDGVRQVESKMSLEEFVQSVQHDRRKKIVTAKEDGTLPDTVWINAARAEKVSNHTAEDACGKAQKHASGNRENAPREPAAANEEAALRMYLRLCLEDARLIRSPDPMQRELIDRWLCAAGLLQKYGSAENWFRRHYELCRRAAARIQSGAI